MRLGEGSVDVGIDYSLCRIRAANVGVGVLIGQSLVVTLVGLSRSVCRSRSGWTPLRARFMHSASSQPATSTFPSCTAVVVELESRILP